LEGRHFCPKIMYENLTECPNSMWYLSKKLSKCTIFHDICLKKITKFAEFYMIIARKIFFPV